MCPTDTASLRVASIGINSTLSRQIGDALASSSWAAFDYIACRDPAAAGQAAEARPIDAIIVALDPPEAQNIQAVARLKQAFADTLVFPVGATDGEDIVRAAIELGASDYLVLSDWRVLAALPRSIVTAAERASANTRNRKLQQARKDTETLLSKVFSVVTDGVSITDAEGRLLVVNQALSKMSGWPIQELVGQPFTKVTLAAERENYLAAYRKAVEAERDYDGVISLQRKDGEVVPIQMRSVFVQLADDRVCRVGAYNEVRGADSEEAIERFGKDVQEILRDNGGQLTAGRLQMIGLKEIKQQFGDRWPKIAARAYATAERIIGNRMSRKDAFVRNEKGDFVICFGELDEQEAWFKAQAIGKEIRAALLGQDAVDPSGLAELAAQGQGDFADLAPAELQKLAETNAQAHAVKVTPEEAAESSDLADLIESRLKQAQDRLRNNAKAVLRELYESCRIEPRPIVKRVGRPSDFVIADIDRGSRARISQLMDATAEKADILAEVDYLSLGVAAQYVIEATGPTPPIAVVEVDFRTLHDKRYHERYVALCRSLPENVRGSIVLNLKNVGDEIQATKISDITRLLQPFCRSWMMRLAKPQINGVRLSEALISHVLVDFDEVQPALIRNRPAFVAFAEQVHAGGAEIVVDNVPNPKAAWLLKGAQVDLLSLVGPGAAPPATGQAAAS